MLTVVRLLTDVGFEFLAPDETIMPAPPLGVNASTDITFDSVFENRDNDEWPAVKSSAWAGLVGYNGATAHGRTVHTSYNLLA